MKKIIQLKSLFVVAACLLCSVAASAQMGVSFTLNDAGGESVPYATVYIYHSGDTVNVVTTGVTDIDGHFAQPIKAAGKYLLKATFVGMDATKAEFEVSANRPQADLGTLTMSNSETTLKAVVVTAQRQLVKSEIDRLSYDIQADADSKTNNVLEMLKKVPLVSVDGQDEIRVKGSTSFKIYRNGHPDPALGTDPKNILKAVPASMIKRIEVITDPGAKYDAEGTSAILNIVMVDNSQVNGATGTIGASVDMYGGLGAYANVTTQLGKVVANVNYGYHRQNRNRAHNLTEGHTFYGDTGNEFTAFNDSRANVNVHYGDLSASWEPDTLNLLSASAGGYYYDYAGDGLNSMAMTTPSGATIYSYKSKGNTPGNSFYDLHGRADFQHKTRRAGETLTLSYMLTTSRNATEVSEQYYDMVDWSFPYTGSFNKGMEKFAEHTAQFDWTRPFAKYHKFETGVKYINRHNKSDNLHLYTDAPDMDTHTLFNHNTQVGAAYLSHSYTRGKWSTRAGLRYEFSHLNGKYPDAPEKNYHRNLSDWVPNFSVQYQPNWANSYKLAFSTNIQRPGINFLNPAVNETPTSISFGNAHLESAREYNISFTYMRIGSKLTFNVAPSVALSNNKIIGVQYLESGKTVSTYANELNSCYVGLSGFAQWRIAMATSMMVNGNVGYDMNHSDRLSLDNDRWRAFVYGQVTQFLPWKLRVSVGGGYWNGGANGLYGYSRGTGFYNLSLQRSFLKEDRLTVQLQAQNFLGDKFTTIKSFTTQGDFTGWNASKWIARSVGINVSYRFGSLKAKVKKTNTTIENNDMVGGNKGGGDNNQQGSQQQ